MLRGQEPADTFWLEELQARSPAAFWTKRRGTALYAPWVTWRPEVHRFVATPAHKAAVAAALPILRCRARLPAHVVELIFSKIDPLEPAPPKKQAPRPMPVRAAGAGRSQPRECACGQSAAVACALAMCATCCCARADGSPCSRHRSLLR